MNEVIVSSRPPGKLKSVVLQWLGVQVSSLAAVPGLGLSGGVVSNADQALRISAVWACVRLISQTVATLPLTLYKRGKGGVGQAPAYDENLYALLHDAPNDAMTASDFWECVVASMVMRGNAYIEIMRSGGADNTIVALNFCIPDRMTVYADTVSGGLSYDYVDPITARTRKIAATSMMHIRGFSLNGIVGVTPIAVARHIFGSAAATDTAARAVFANGLMIRGTFQTDQVVKEGQRAAFSQKLKEYEGALGNGSTPLLEAGVKFVPTSLNPDDAQMLQTRGFNVEEICRFFGVPPFMVGHAAAGDTGWGTGLESKKIAFLTFGLRFWLVRIEQSISKNLIDPPKRGKFFAKFGLEGLLRADSAARAAFYTTMVQNGIMTRDECRALEDLEPMGGNAAVLTAQNIMIPLDDLTAPASNGAAADAQSALKSWLGIIERAA